MRSSTVGRHAVRLVGVVLLAASAFRPVPLPAAHPLITEDTGTQGRGNFQLELTTEHALEEEGGTPRDHGAHERGADLWCA